MNDFKVTREAMRPASEKEQCFYCGQKIGENHKDDCVLINKKVMVRMIVEYEIEVPNHWNEENVLFHRNEGSWCSDNAINELEELSQGGQCLCGKTKFEYIGGESEPFLDES